MKEAIDMPIALHLREMWCEYFNGVGAVPWQDRAIDH